MKVVLDHVLGREPMPDCLARGLSLLPGGATPRGVLVWMALAGLGIFAVNSAADIVLARAWVRVGQGMVYRLAGDLFAHIQRRSLLFHSRNSVGDSMSRITGDSWCAYKAVDTLLFTPGYALVMTAGMVTVMAHMDLGLTLLALAVAPFVAVTSFSLGRPIRRAARLRREIDGRIQAHVQRTLGAIQVVQAFAQEEQEERRFRECTESALQSQRRLTLVNGLYNLASGLILTLGAGAILWTGARHVLNGTLSVGGLLVFLTYLTMLQAQMKAFTGIYGTMQEIGAGVDRVLEVLDADHEIADRPGAMALSAARGHVRLEEVTFGYEMGRPVLRGVCLEALPGQTIALV